MTEITEPVSGATKAAIFLMGLGDQVSAELLRQLDPDEIRRVTSEITALEAVAPHHMVSVFREFESLTGSSRFFAKGGAGFARRLVEQALGPEHANKLLNSPEQPASSQADPNPELRILENTEPRQLARTRLGWVKNSRFCYSQVRYAKAYDDYHRTAGELES